MTVQETVIAKMECVYVSLVLLMQTVLKLLVKIIATVSLYLLIQDHGFCIEKRCICEPNYEGAACEYAI